MTDDAGPLNEFLHRFLDDQERGAVQTVEHYQALFPGSDAAIASEYASLTGAGRDAPAREDVGLSQIGPYRLLGKLGHGSFGLVYRAEDVRLHRTVALKVLARAGLETDREREQFEREAVIASRLDHPGICTVHEVARHGLWTCIAMRLVPGETLAARLARASHEPLPVATALALVERVARALHAAHAAGVVHRDVKPGNVMVQPDGEPVVVDFGLARDATGAAGSVSANAERVGSPSYMAPEQIEPSIGAVDARTDVWALGVVLHECLAGARPFEAPTQAGLFDAILRREPAALPRARGISADLAVVLGTALAKEPVRRYQSALAFADDLQRAQRGEPVLARPIGRVARLLRWMRRNPAVAGLLGAVLLLLGSGLLVAGMLWMRAADSLRDWERLADGRRAVRLQEIAVSLLPPGPDKVPGMEAWLAEARALLRRRSEHEQALAALRERARPWSSSTELLEQQRNRGPQRDFAAAGQRLEILRGRLAAVESEGHPAAKVPRFRAALAARIDLARDEQRAAEVAIAERRSYEFDDVRDQLQHDQIADLVLALRRLGGERDPTIATTTVAMMEKWLEAARTLRQRTIDDHAEAWRHSVERVARNPAYQNIPFGPQPGLVPLGQDPQSGLEEFAAPETGMVPVRRDGRLAIGPDTALVFVLIPPGRFTMGAQSAERQAPGYDPLAAADEAPVRSLEAGAFFLSKYEMTQGQWLTAFGWNPSRYNQGERDGEVSIDTDHPVETVSWRDCATMLGHLGWWLPTEARWEYACRAGTTTPWWCAETEILQCGNLADRRYRAWDTRTVAFVDGDDGHAMHAPVGSYRPNAFGLHDMIGNVAEWCFEKIQPYDPRRTNADAVPHVAWGEHYVMRGGSIETVAASARSSARSSYEGTVRSYSVGVRPMRALVHP